MIWLGGSTAVARRKWLKREAQRPVPIPPEALALQLERISRIDLNSFGAWAWTHSREVEHSSTRE